MGRRRAGWGSWARLLASTLAAGGGGALGAAEPAPAAPPAYILVGKDAAWTVRLHVTMMDHGSDYFFAPARDGVLGCGCGGRRRGGGGRPWRAISTHGGDDGVDITVVYADGAPVVVKLSPASTIDSRWNLDGGIAITCERTLRTLDKDAAQNARAAAPHPPVP
jgi:hypothetical protein